MTRARWPLILLCCLLPLVVLWPVVLRPGASLVGDEGVDVWSHVWGISWFAESIAAMEEAEAAGRVISEGVWRRLSYVSEREAIALLSGLRAA